MTTSSLNVIKTPLQEPWIDPDGKVLSDAQLRLVSRNWDAETWERYLSSLEPSLTEVQISPRRFGILAALRKFEACSSDDEGSIDPSHLELQGAIDQLTDKQRQVVELIFFKNKSSRQVSKTVGISQSTVRDLKRKALKNLRRLLAGGTLNFPIVRGEVNHKEDSNV